MPHTDGFHKWRWRFLIVWVVLFTIVTVWALQIARDESQAGSHARQAICALVNDLRSRVDSGERFLDNHPRGIPGVPASTIRTNLKNQRATIMVLDRAVNCP